MITNFSTSTLKTINKDKLRKYYVYCLVDPNNNLPFYVGKGINNRVFSHQKLAMERSNQKLKEELDFESEKALKLDRIVDILKAGKQIESYIISYGLTEKEAFAAENAVINFLKVVQNVPLTNLISGHGSSCLTVEALEMKFGYQSIEESSILTNSLILAVKIKDGFNLSLDESMEYPINQRDHHNLKSRTLGEWGIGRDKIAKIQYIIGINTGADNAVVSAYKVSVDYSECKDGAQGRKRYSFNSLSKRDETLKELGLFKKSLPALKFGRGGSTTYVQNLRR